jgi:hypothetical protein
MTTFVKRDLGFPGRLGCNIFLSYGDTMYAPLEVIDIHLNAQGHPRQFCPIMAEYGEDPATHALGITNIVETYPGQGMLKCICIDSHC